MSGKKGERNRGQPIIRVKYQPATAQQVLDNRRRLEEAVGAALGAKEQKSLKATIRWGEKPEHYGETRLCLGEEILYPGTIDFKELPLWAQDALLHSQG